MLSDLVAFAGFNIMYATYLEINPKLGGVVIRPDSEGNKKVNLKSYFNFIKQPFNSQNKEVQKELWKPKNWDINYAVCATTFMTGFQILKAIINSDDDDNQKEKTEKEKKE